MKTRTPNIIAGCESLYLSANILVLTHCTWDASWNLSFRPRATLGLVSCCHTVLLHGHFTVIFNNLKSDIITVGFPIVTFQRGTASRRSVQMEFKAVITIDGSPPSSLVQGILQARILEWVAISFSWLACLVPGRLNEENNSKNKIIPGNFQVKFHNSKYKKIKKKKINWLYCISPK